MKEKILEYMNKNNWQFQDINDFNVIYNNHLFFIKSLCDYFQECTEVDLNDIDEEKMTDMVVFMYDFLRAFNDLDEREIQTDDFVNDAKIELVNFNEVPYSFSNLGANCYKIDNEIRKCRWNFEDIVGVLNYHSNQDIWGANSLYYHNWECILYQYDIMRFKGVDSIGNIAILNIERKNKR